LVAYQGPRLLGARREVEGLDARRMILCMVHPYLLYKRDEHQYIFWFDDGVIRPLISPLLEG